MVLVAPYDSIQQIYILIKLWGILALSAVLGGTTCQHNGWQIKSGQKGWFFNTLQLCTKPMLWK